MSAKHTPGPWKWTAWNALQGKGYVEVLRAVDAGYGEYEIECDNDADKHLIAAAPELLEALKGALDCFDCEDGMVADACINAARAAIAKATQP